MTSLIQYYFQATARVSNTAPQWAEGHSAPVSQDSPFRPMDAPVRVRNQNAAIMPSTLCYITPRQRVETLCGHRSEKWLAI